MRSALPRRLPRRTWRTHRHRSIRRCRITPRRRRWRRGRRRSIRGGCGGRCRFPRASARVRSRLGTPKRHRSDRPCRTVGPSRRRLAGSGIRSVTPAPAAACSCGRGRRRRRPASGRRRSASTAAGRFVSKTGTSNAGSAGGRRRQRTARWCCSVATPVPTARPAGAASRRVRRCGGRSTRRPAAACRG